MSSLFVLSGPSGAGKSVLIRRILREFSDIRFSISSTTRAPRSGETDGVQYHFTDRETFVAELEAGEFFEHAEFSGNLYGTHSKELIEASKAGHDLILDIEVQGARQLKQKQIEAVFVFILPPSFAELERRLRERNTESEEVIQRRLRQGRKDVSDLDLYDYIVVNDQLDEAYDRLRAIFLAERSRRRQMQPILQPILDSFQNK